MDHSATNNKPLQKMFMEVTPTYDLVNRLLTFRFDIVWRRRAARQCLKNNPDKILDLCCGTGDLTVELKSLAACTAEVFALDFSEPMLELARRKTLKKKLTGIKFQQADAAGMPFPNNYFNSIGIAFAFRNLTYHNPDGEKYLSEVLRVLNPGGQFVIVETSQPENNMLRKLFHFYMRYIVEPVGSLISGHHGAYRYFAHSVINFYNKEQIKDLLIKAGFSKVESCSLFWGVAGLFVATK